MCLKCIPAVFTSTSEHHRAASGMPVDANWINSVNEAGGFPSSPRTCIFQRVFIQLIFKILGIIFAVFPLMNGRHARLEAVPAGTTGEKESDIPAPIVYHHQIRDGAFPQVSSLNNSQHVRLLTSLSLQQSLGDQTGEVIPRLLHVGNFRA